MGFSPPPYLPYDPYIFVQWCSHTQSWGNQLLYNEEEHYRNYAVTIWKHWQPCGLLDIFNTTCMARTNHEALKSLMNTPHPCRKLLHIHYQPGKKNANADALSRCPRKILSASPADQRVVLKTRELTAMQSQFVMKGVSFHLTRHCFIHCCLTCYTVENLEVICMMHSEISRPKMRTGITKCATTRAVKPSLMPIPVSDRVGVEFPKSARGNQHAYRLFVEVAWSARWEDQTALDRIDHDWAHPSELLLAVPPWCTKVIDCCESIPPQIVCWEEIDRHVGACDPMMKCMLLLKTMSEKSHSGWWKRAQFQVAQKKKTACPTLFSAGDRVFVWC